MTKKDNRANLSQHELTFSLDNVPYAEDYFFADRGKLTLDGDQLIFSFTTITTIEKQVSLCVEIALPIDLAITQLYKANFIDASLNGDKMSDVIKKASEVLKTKYKCPQELDKIEYPKDSSNYRKFSSNFLSSCVIQGQACLEFYQIPPRMLVDRMFKNVTGSAKRNGRVSNVISIIATTFLIDAILSEGERLLKPLFKEEKNV